MCAYTTKNMMCRFLRLPNVCVVRRKQRFPLVLVWYMEPKIMGVREACEKVGSWSCEPLEEEGGSVWSRWSLLSDRIMSCATTYPFSFSSNCYFHVSHVATLVICSINLPTLPSVRVICMASSSMSSFCRYVRRIEELMWYWGFVMFVDVVRQVAVDRI